MNCRGVVVRNVLSTVMTQFVTWTLGFAVTFFLPRYLGADGLGTLTFATSLVGVFAIPVQWGTSSVLVREISRDRSRVTELVIPAVLLRIVMAIVMGGIAVMATMVLRQPPTVQLLVLIAVLAMAIYFTNDAFAAGLRGLENLPRQNTAVVVEKVGYSLLIIALVLRRAPLWEIGAVPVAAGLLSLAVNLTAFRAHWRGMFRPKPASMKFLMVAGLPFVSLYIFNQLYGQIDPLILGLLTNSTNVGWYAAALRLFQNGLFFTTALAGAIFPTLARLYVEDRAGFQKMVERVFALAVLCSIPVALVLICLPELLLAFLHFPSSYAGAIPVMRISGVCVVLNSIAVVMGTAVSASDGQVKLAQLMVKGCVVGIPLCILATYIGQRMWGNGAAGAMASDALLEIYLITGYVQILPPAVIKGEMVRFVGRSILAGAPVAAWLLLLSHLQRGPLWLLPAVPLYAVACWYCGCMERDSLKLAMQLIGRRVQA